MDSPKPSRPEIANCAVKEPYSSMSIKEMERWFIPLTASSQTLQELSNGVIYSTLLVELFPDCLNPKKLKTGAKLSYQDKLTNWKVLQSGLMKLNLKTEVDIRQMIKPNIAAAMHFCKWWIAFYELHSNGPILVPTVSKAPPTPASRTATPRRPQFRTPRPEMKANLKAMVKEDEDVTQRGSPIKIQWETEEDMQKALLLGTPTVFQIPETSPSLRHVTLTRRVAGSLIDHLDCLLLHPDESLPDLVLDTEESSAAEEHQLVEETPQELDLSEIQKDQLPHEETEDALKSAPEVEEEVALVTPKNLNLVPKAIDWTAVDLSLRKSVSVFSFYWTGSWTLPWPRL